MSVFPVRVLASAALLAAMGVSACAPLRTHQGYVIDKELAAAIQPGVDNRDSVLKTLGQPTLKSQFDDREWYYISRNSRNMSFNNPRASDQQTMRVIFDGDGNVAQVDNTGKELIASVNPYGKTTPTLGRKRGFFEDLFGNIGTVGAPGMGGDGGAPGQ